MHYRRATDCIPGAACMINVSLNDYRILLWTSVYVWVQSSLSSSLMPKLCFRQRLLKLWSPCKKHPWNESHSLSNQFVQNVNTHWYPENRAGVVNAYLSTVIPISDIHFFTRKKTSAASVVLKKILNSVSWKWKLNISTPQSPCAHQEAPKLLWQQPWSCVTGVHEKPLLRPFAVFLTCSSKPNLASEVRPFGNI